MQHRAGEHIPRHLHRAAALQHDADVRIDLRDLAQKVELVFAQAHMFAVVPFRFAALVQTEEEQHLIASRGERPCPAQQPRRSGSAAEKALFVSGDVHAGSAQRVERRVHLRGIDARAARALIARRFGKVADHGNFCALGQRQQVVLVFQQHNAVGGQGTGFRCDFGNSKLADNGSTVQFLLQAGFCLRLAMKEGTQILPWMHRGHQSFLRCIVYVVILLENAGVVNREDRKFCTPAMSTSMCMR